MSRYKIKPWNPDGLRTQSLRSRPSKVQVNDFTTPFPSGGGVQDFLDSVPNILAGRDFKELVDRLKSARERKKAILFAMGAHVIKVGLSPILIDLMSRGWISALALNGAGVVHDFEIAFNGQTSEDVESRLRDGRFGMSEETGRYLNEAVSSAESDVGLGESVGRMISVSDWPHIESSLLAAAYRLEVPVTVHVALGTDVIHVHPELDAEALGRTAMRDFYLFCSLVEGLDGGGVFLNVGSAVILPEVFLKALSAVRGSGRSVEEFTTAVFDFNHHYRPLQNVVRRPVGSVGSVGSGGRGYYLIGHHELMIPLLAAALTS